MSDAVKKEKIKKVSYFKEDIGIQKVKEMGEHENVHPLALKHYEFVPKTNADSIEVVADLLEVDATPRPPQEIEAEGARRGEVVVGEFVLKKSDFENEIDRLKKENDELKKKHDREVALYGELAINSVLNIDCLPKHLKSIYGVTDANDRNKMVTHLNVRQLNLDAWPEDVNAPFFADAKSISIAPHVNPKDNAVKKNNADYQPFIEMTLKAGEGFIEYVKSEFQKKNYSIEYPGGLLSNKNTADLKLANGKNFPVNNIQYLFPVTSKSEPINLGFDDIKHFKQNELDAIKFYNRTIKAKRQEVLDEVFGKEQTLIDHHDVKTVSKIKADDFEDIETTYRSLRILYNIKDTKDSIRKDKSGKTYLGFDSYNKLLGLKVLGRLHAARGSDYQGKPTLEQALNRNLRLIAENSSILIDRTQKQQEIKDDAKKIKDAEEKIKGLQDDMDNIFKNGADQVAYGVYAPSTDRVLPSISEKYLVIKKDNIERDKEVTRIYTEVTNTRVIKEGEVNNLEIAHNNREIEIKNDIRIDYNNLRYIYSTKPSDIIKDIGDKESFLRRIEQECNKKDVQGNSYLGFKQQIETKLHEWNEEKIPDYANQVENLKSERDMLESLKAYIGMMEDGKTITAVELRSLFEDYINTQQIDFRTLIGNDYLDKIIDEITFNVDANNIPISHIGLVAERILNDLDGRIVGRQNDIKNQKIYSNISDLNLDYDSIQEYKEIQQSLQDDKKRLNEFFIKGYPDLKVAQVKEIGRLKKETDDFLVGNYGIKSSDLNNKSANINNRIDSENLNIRNHNKSLSLSFVEIKRIETDIADIDHEIGQITSSSDEVFFSNLAHYNDLVERREQLLGDYNSALQNAHGQMNTDPQLITDKSNFDAYFNGVVRKYDIDKVSYISQHILSQDPFLQKQKALLDTVQKMINNLPANTDINLSRDAFITQFQSILPSAVNDGVKRGDIEAFVDELFDNKSQISLNDLKTQIEKRLEEVEDFVDVCKRELDKQFTKPTIKAIEDVLKLNIDGQKVNFNGQESIVPQPLTIDSRARMSGYAALKKRQIEEDRALVGIEDDIKSKRTKAQSNITNTLNEVNTRISINNQTITNNNNLIVNSQIELQKITTNLKTAKANQDNQEYSRQLLLFEKEKNKIKKAQEENLGAQEELKSLIEGLNFKPEIDRFANEQQVALSKLGRESIKMKDAFTKIRTFINNVTGGDPDYTFNKEDLENELNRVLNGEDQHNIDNIVNELFSYTDSNSTTMTASSLLYVITIREAEVSGREQKAKEEIEKQLELLKIKEILPSHKIDDKIQNGKINFTVVKPEINPPSYLSMEDDTNPLQQLSPVDDYEGKGLPTTSQILEGYAKYRIAADEEQKRIIGLIEKVKNATKAANGDIEGYILLGNAGIEIHNGGIEHNNEQLLGIKVSLEEQLSAMQKAVSDRESVINGAKGRDLTSAEKETLEGINASYKTAKDEFNKIKRAINDPNGPLKKNEGLIGEGRKIIKDAIADFVKAGEGWVKAMEDFYGEAKHKLTDDYDKLIQIIDNSGLPDNTIITRKDLEKEFNILFGADSTEASHFTNEIFMSQDGEAIITLGDLKRQIQNVLLDTESKTTNVHTKIAGEKLNDAVLTPISQSVGVNVDDTKNDITFGILPSEEIDIPIIPTTNSLVKSPIIKFDTGTSLPSIENSTVHFEDSLDNSAFSIIKGYPAYKSVAMATTSEINKIKDKATNHYHEEQEAINKAVNDFKEKQEKVIFTIESNNKEILIYKNRIKKFSITNRGTLELLKILAKKRMSIEDEKQYEKLKKRCADEKEEMDDILVYIKRLQQQNETIQRSLSRESDNFERDMTEFIKKGDQDIKNKYLEEIKKEKATFDSEFNKIKGIIDIAKRNGLNEFKREDFEEEFNKVFGKKTPDEIKSLVNELFGDDPNKKTITIEQFEEAVKKRYDEVELVFNEKCREVERLSLKKGNILSVENESITIDVDDKDRDYYDIFFKNIPSPQPPQPSSTGSQPPKTEESIRVYLDRTPSLEDLNNEYETVDDMYITGGKVYKKYDVKYENGKRVDDKRARSFYSYKNTDKQGENFGIDAELAYFNGQHGAKFETEDKRAVGNNICGLAVRDIKISLEEDFEKFSPEARKRHEQLSFAFGVKENELRDVVMRKVADVGKIEGLLNEVNGKGDDATRLSDSEKEEKNKQITNITKAFVEVKANTFRKENVLTREIFRDDRKSFAKDGIQLTIDPEAFVAQNQTDKMITTDLVGTGLYAFQYGLKENGQPDLENMRIVERKNGNKKEFEEVTDPEKLKGLRKRLPKKITMCQSNGVEKSVPIDLKPVVENLIDAKIEDKVFTTDVKLNEIPGKKSPTDFREKEKQREKQREDEVDDIELSVNIDF
jgi:hypothetical protein